MEHARYKTWVRTRPIAIFAVLSAVSVALSTLAAWKLFFLVFLVPAAIFGYILLVVGLAWWRLSPAGGDYQNTIHQLIVSRTIGDRILDIGCGSGHLLAEIARAHPAASLVGLDYWGPNWEYSKELCETNIRAEGLEGRAQFIQGSTSALPATLGTFDCVVSCMTFHEVRDVEDKTVSVRQAVGRLAPGGRFVFIDLFGDTSFYPNTAAIDVAILDSGAHIAEQSALGNLMPMPYPLGHKRVFGNAQIIVGEKPA